MSDPILPPTVRHIALDGRDIYLVGTAHVSKQSVADVTATVAAVMPDTICVELCAARHKSLSDPDGWKKMDIFKVIRQKKSLFLFAQLILASFYRRLGRELDVVPGAEMLEGVKLAQSTGAELVLADRDITLTLKRIWAGLGFWNKMKLISSYMASFFEKTEIDATTIENLKQQDQLESVLHSFEESFPGIRERLIDERDIYLAEKIRASKGTRIVAIVGAGHCPGIERHIGTPADLSELETVPRPSIWPTIIGWGIPLLIMALIGALFAKGGAELSVNSGILWAVIVGVLSALGTALAFGHPLAIITSLLTAWIGAILPIVGVGMFAATVQAFVKRPTVSDMENLPADLESVKGAWRNPVSRIFLVLMLANLGSTLGTLISTSILVKRLFG